MILYWRSVLQC